MQTAAQPAGATELTTPSALPALAVIGGETAYQLLRRLGARRLEVFERKAEVIAISRIGSGVMDGCRFVSKGGSVGPDDAACQMLSLLTS